MYTLNETVYKQHDNRILLKVEQDGIALDLGQVNRWVLTFKREASAVVLDSDVDSSWCSIVSREENGTPIKLLELDLGGVGSLTPGIWTLRMVGYSQDHEEGVVFADHSNAQIYVK